MARQKFKWMRARNPDIVADLSTATDVYNNKEIDAIGNAKGSVIIASNTNLIRTATESRCPMQVL